jgi:hypothetical protein
MVVVGALKGSSSSFLQHGSYAFAAASSGILDPHLCLGAIAITIKGAEVIFYD